MSIIRCPECGKKVSDRARTCPSCGVDIAGSIVVCPVCGTTRFPEVEQCPKCAAKARKRIKFKHFSISRTSLVLFPLLLIVTALVIGGYYWMRNQSERQAYESAMESPLPPILRAYLDKHGSYAPDEHLNAVNSILQQHDAMTSAWEKAIAHPSKTALQAFMLNFPKSVYVTEAKAVIDSLDWLEVTKSPTLEAYRSYIDNHPSGAYIDEARQSYSELFSTTISAADSSLVVRSLQSYCDAISSSDEEGVRAVFTARIESFLGKLNSTRSDVVAYMKRLHAPKDVRSVVMKPLGQWHIAKEQVEGRVYFIVRFSADLKIERKDRTKFTFLTYKVTSRLNANGKIVSLDMDLKE